MDLIGVIDQGTSSSRFILFEANNVTPLTYHQIEIPTSSPENGWAQQDAKLMVSTTIRCIDKTLESLQLQGDTRVAERIKCMGIANQRETVVVWDVETGEPLYDAILWLDGRTTQYVDQIVKMEPGQVEVLREKTGLTVSNYFSALKIKWLMDNVPEVNQALERGTCRFGTVDTWLIWNLTGGVKGGVYVTDVSNASRTMLMNIRTLDWDPELCRYFKVPVEALPKIRSSSEIYGRIESVPGVNSIPISSCLGDQQAALLGHKSFKPGDAKCTFGTGCFLVFNTGDKLVNNTKGLLATVAWKLGPESPVVYALEGSAGTAGAAIRWLKDGLNMANSYEELSTLVDSIKDTEGVYFVPAFSGLLAPHWRPDARGTICGLSTASTKAHIVRAAFEAIAFMVQDILNAMGDDPELQLSSLKVDGGVTTSSAFVQLLADVIGIDTLRSGISEATALGAAMAAGHAAGVGIWKMEEEGVGTSILPYDTFTSKVSEEDRAKKYAGWQKAVTKSFDMD